MITKSPTTPPPSAPATRSDLRSAAGYIRALSAADGAITRAVVDARTARRPAIRPLGLAVVVVVSSSSWRARAACLGLDPNMFFPERFDRATVDAAVAVCARCPVRALCLLEALTLEDGHGGFGVWGGMSEKDRRVLRRSLPRWARCAGCGDRYRKTTSGQRYCAPGCRSISVKWRRDSRRVAS